MVATFPSPPLMTLPENTAIQITVADNNSIRWQLQQLCQSFYFILAEMIFLAEFLRSACYLVDK